MGLFGQKKDALADAGYAYATEPGAIPVATPLLMEETPFLQADKVQKVAVAQPVVASMTTPTISQQRVQQSPYGATNDPTLSRGPMMIRQCPHCRQESRTRVTTAPVWQTWAASGILCFVFWPIFWVPLVVDNCKDTSHYCVLCGAEVGKVSAFEDCCVTNRG
jgi:lipopolysaccharide-induced tumor necrosis factor-alpha factor